MIFADVLVRSDIFPTVPFFKIDRTLKGVNPWALREHGMQTLSEDNAELESPQDTVNKIIAAVDNLTKPEEGAPANVDQAVLVTGRIDP